MSAFFLQLVATNIVSFEWANVGRDVHMVLTKDGENKHLFQKCKPMGRV